MISKQIEHGHAQFRSVHELISPGTHTVYISDIF